MEGDVDGVTRDAGGIFYTKLRTCPVWATDGVYTFGRPPTEPKGFHPLAGSKELVRIDVVEALSGE
jgi:hypothetical protein